MVHPLYPEMEEKKVRQLKTDDRNIEKDKTFQDDPQDVWREIWGFWNAELRFWTDSQKQVPTLSQQISGGESQRFPPHKKLDGCCH